MQPCHVLHHTVPHSRVRHSPSVYTRQTMTSCALYVWFIKLQMRQLVCFFFVFFRLRYLLYNVLRLGSRAASMGTVRVARELDLLAVGKLQDLFETAANTQENIFSLFIRTTLTASDIAVSAARDALTNSTSPDTDTVESLADVDNNAHNLTVVLLLQGLTDSGHDNLKPKTVDVDIALVLVLVGPLASVLVLRIFPLGAHTGLKKMIIGLNR